MLIELKLCLTKISLVLLKLLRFKVNSIIYLVKLQNLKLRSREEERIRKMREDLTIQQESLIEVELTEILSIFKEKGSKTGKGGLG